MADPQNTASTAPAATTGDAGRDYAHQEDELCEPKSSSIRSGSPQQDLASSAIPQAPSAPPPDNDAPNPGICGTKRPSPAQPFPWNDILRAQNMIERCLQQYLSKHGKSAVNGHTTTTPRRSASIVLAQSRVFLVVVEYEAPANDSRSGERASPPTWHIGVGVFFPATPVAQETDCVR